MDVKKLERNLFTVKDFIENHKTEKHVNMLEKTLELYKKYDAKDLNEYLVNKLEYLLYNKKPTHKVLCGFTVEQILNMYNAEDFRDYIRNIFDHFEMKLDFNKEFGYANPPDDVIEFWENTYEYFKDFAKKEDDKKYWRKRKISHNYKNEDIIITDACYLFADNDELDRKIEPPYNLYADTIYGDWSCTCYDKDAKKAIGHFCADAGNVCIAKLKDVLEFNPNFKDWMDKHDWCVTLIKNFTGTAYIKYDIQHYEYKGKKMRDLFCYVEGKGNINFTSNQTGF